MNATTVAVDLAKNVFQLAYADANGRLIATARLTRPQFQRCFHNSSVCLVIMEACGTAPYWARQIQALGIEVRLLPARYIRAYVKRNKTDAADAAALLEAARCADIQPVKIKSVEQQTLQSLHRTRSLWMTTRTSLYQCPARLLPRARYRYRPRRSAGPGADCSSPGRPELTVARAAAHQHAFDDR